MELTLAVIVVWVLSTCLHEFGHAIVAYWGGDLSVKEKGYLTLNPIAYFNSATTLVLPLMILLIGGLPLPGAAVYINTGRIKNRLWQSFVSFAGPLFTLFFLIFISVLYQFLPQLQTEIGDGKLFDTISGALSLLIYLHIYVLILNLLPLPPLDGFGIIEPWLPAEMRLAINKHKNLGFLLLILLFFYCDPVVECMQTVVIVVTSLIGVDLKEVSFGLKTLRANSLPLVGVIIVGWIIRSKLGPPAEKANALLLRGKVSEAKELYEKALSQKRTPEVLTAYASCLLNQGDAKTAISILRESYALEPQNPKTLGMLGACLFEARQFDEAIETADKALAAAGDSDLGFAHLIKASAFLEQEQFQNALSSVDRFLDKEPHSANGLFIRASCQEALGKFDDAIVTYSKAARSKEGYLRASLAKGILLCALDRQEEGKRELVKVLNSVKPETRAEELNKLRMLINESEQLYRSRGKEDMALALAKAKDTLS